MAQINGIGKTRGVNPETVKEQGGRVLRHGYGRVVEMVIVVVCMYVVGGVVVVVVVIVLVVGVVIASVVGVVVSSTSYLKYLYVVNVL